MGVWQCHSGQLAEGDCVEAVGVIIIIIDHLHMQPDGYGAVIYIF